MHVMYVQKFVTKCAKILLRNARCHKMRRNFVTKCARCYIMRSCYKMRLNKPAANTPDCVNLLHLLKLMTLHNLKQTHHLQCWKMEMEISWKAEMYNKLYNYWIAWLNIELSLHGSSSSRAEVFLQQQQHCKIQKQVSSLVENPTCVDD